MYHRKQKTHILAHVRMRFIIPFFTGKLLKNSYAAAPLVHNFVQKKHTHGRTRLNYADVMEAIASMASPTKIWE